MNSKINAGIERLENVTYEGQSFLSKVSSEGYDNVLTYKELIDMGTLLGKEAEVLNTYKDICYEIGKLYSVRSSIRALKTLVTSNFSSILQRDKLNSIITCEGILPDVIDGLIVLRGGLEYILKFYNSSKYVMHSGRGM